jgi:hypothetical protein
MSKTSAHPEIYFTPIIVGVGDVINRSLEVEDAIEPLELMIRAIQKALQDTGVNDKLQKELEHAIDSIDVVRPRTWPYEDLPELLANRLSVKPTHKFISPNGGNELVKLVDEAAKRIALGETKVAIVTGGEALASCKCFINICAHPDHYK